MTALLRRAPLVPVIGAATRLQPVHVDDLAAGLERALAEAGTAGQIIEAAGPRVCTLLELLIRLRRHAHTRCALLPLPYATALLMATVAERLPGRPLCRDQVRLMRTDKVASGARPDLAALGVAARDPLAQAQW